MTDRHLIVSIAAGVPLQTVAEGLGPERRLVRVMPNTPCLVGASASATRPATTATADDVALVDRLLKAVGVAFRVPEQSARRRDRPERQRAGVRVSDDRGAVSDGGVRVGLPRDVATALAAQTVLGAAKMVLETGSHPGVLKDQVASPGGTTIAGLHALERGGVRAALMDAVEAATRRATELGKTCMMAKHAMPARPLRRSSRASEGPIKDARARAGFAELGRTSCT